LYTMNNYNAPQIIDELSLSANDVSNISEPDYEEEVLKLLSKSESGWSCTKCPHATKSKQHIQEHVEKHIEGFSFECKLCDKKFTKKRSLRSHKYLCKAVEL